MGVFRCKFPFTFRGSLRVPLWVPAKVSFRVALRVLQGLYVGALRLRVPFPGHQNSPKALYSMVFGPKSLNI